MSVRCRGKHDLKKTCETTPPCNLHKGEAEIVADCLVETLDQACAGKITGRLLTDIRRARTDGVVGWLT
jgi:hypothetical protein